MKSCSCFWLFMGYNFFVCMKINNIILYIMYFLGNPVASCVTFNLFVLPSLHRLSGHAEPQQMKIKVKVIIK